MPSKLELEKIWSKLCEKYFWAEVSVNCRKIGVLIKYFPPFDMKIDGLEPEYPPYVWFKNTTIMISHDQREWRSVPLESGIQILRLLDPRVLFTPARPPILRVIEHLKTEVGIIGKYDLSYLNKAGKPEPKLPEELIKWMEENDQKERSVKILLRKDYLIDKMIQNDLPPSSDEVTLTFKYE